MKILVTGASGLIGSALVPSLVFRGHRVIRLVRRNPRPASDEIPWDPEGGSIDAQSLEEFDVVVHLAGESIAAGRWTAARKQRILDSRVKGTDLLARTLISLRRPPHTVISTSAVGYYGNRGGEILREDSGPGSGFLAEVCRQWEQAADIAAAGGIRLIVLRLGMVLSSAGGALRRMLPPFRLGIGGRLGSGNQYIGWLALDDLPEIISFCLLHPTLNGAINAVAPSPITNSEFTRLLGRALRRPAIFPVPEAAILLMFGEMGRELLLAGARVVPARLIEAGYHFRYPELEAALRHILAS